MASPTSTTVRTSASFLFFALCGAFCVVATAWPVGIFELPSAARKLSPTFASSSSSSLLRPFLSPLPFKQEGEKATFPRRACEKNEDDLSSTSTTTSTSTTETTTTGRTGTPQRPASKIRASATHHEDLVEAFSFFSSFPSSSFLDFAAKLHTGCSDSSSASCLLSREEVDRLLLDVFAPHSGSEGRRTIVDPKAFLAAYFEVERAAAAGAFDFPTTPRTTTYRRRRSSRA